MAATSVQNPSAFGSAMVTITAAPTISLSVSPGAATAEVGSTVQFSSLVTGTANTAVTWTVNAQTGGNSNVGTISPTGLYTAPAIVPNPNTVTIGATSLASPSVMASAALAVEPACEWPSGVMTDSTGHATVCSGGITFPLQVDADSGNAITGGLAVAVAVDPLQPGRALLALADPLGNYPFQFRSLGASSPSSAIAAVQPNDSSTAISVPVEIGTGQVVSIAETPIPSISLANLPAPPPQAPSTSDPPVFNLARLSSLALQNLSTLQIPSFLQGKVSVLQSAPIGIQDYIGHLQGEGGNDSIEGLVDIAAQPLGDELGAAPSPPTGLVQTWVSLNVNALKLVEADVCENEGGNEIVEINVKMGLLNVVLPACQYGQPHLGVNFFPPNPNLNVSLKNSQGAAVGPGSLQFIATGDLGVGLATQTTAQGGASVSLPPDTYIVRASSPGYLPTTQAVTAFSSLTSVSFTLQPATAPGSLHFTAPKSGLPAATIGQPYAGFNFCSPPSIPCGATTQQNPSGGEPPYHFQVETGTFPPIGMSLDVNGVLSGTPMGNPGPYPFGVCAVDLAANSVCVPVTLMVGVATSAGFDGSYTLGVGFNLTCDSYPNSLAYQFGLSIQNGQMSVTSVISAPLGDEGLQITSSNGNLSSSGSVQNFSLSTSVYENAPGIGVGTIVTQFTFSGGFSGSSGSGTVSVKQGNCDLNGAQASGNGTWTATKN